MTIQILLSTYNGAAYLKPQLDSLLAQDYPALEILVRDDGSSDETMRILRDYAAVHPNIKIIPGENIGFVQSFLKLVTLTSSTVDFFAFSDQDDIWHRDKISRGIEVISSKSSTAPILYSACATVVDTKLTPLGRTPVPRRNLSFYNALVECPLRGCTLLFNQATRQLLLSQLPHKAYAHDWWIYLVVSAFGEVLYDQRSTMLYRQHGKNVFGVAPTDVNRQGRAQALTLAANQFQRRIHRFLTEGQQQRVMAQAREFQHIYQPLLSSKYQKSLEEFLDSHNSLIKRMKCAISSKFYRQSISDTMILKLLIACNRL